MKQHRKNEYYRKAIELFIEVAQVYDFESVQAIELEMDFRFCGSTKPEHECVEKTVEGVRHNQVMCYRNALFLYRCLGEEEKAEEIRLIIVSLCQEWNSGTWWHDVLCSKYWEE